MFSVTGSLTANGTNFLSTGGGSYITFGSAATLSGGTNTFELADYRTLHLVPSLVGNTSFDEVAIEMAPSPAELSRWTLGTDTSNFYYEFPNGFTVAAGGTMTVRQRAAIQVDRPLSDAGNVTFTTGDELELCYLRRFPSRQPDGQRHQLPQHRRRLVHHIRLRRQPSAAGPIPSTWPLTFPPPRPLARRQYSFDEVAIGNGTISSGTLRSNLLGTDTSTFSMRSPMASPWPPVER